METENQNKGPRIQVVEFKDRITVTRYDDQRLPSHTILLSDEAEGLRNFFQKKRDRELGRWRDPKNPDMVCYPITDRAPVDVRVLDERTGESYFYTRESILGHRFRKTFETAVRYYASHPVMHPWEWAKEGEYWLVTWTHMHTPEPCVVVSVHGDLFFKGITQCRERSSQYIEHAQKLIAEED